MPKAADIEEQAATWLVRKDAGGLSATQQQALEAWQDADPRHRAAYLRLDAAWKRADRLKELQALVGPPAHTAGRDSNQARDTRPRVLHMRVALTIAAAASVLVVVGLVRTLNDDSDNWQTYSTGFGGFERVVLWDGSTVELNAGSEVRVIVSPKRRQIVLARGEANFTVAHDPKRPFEVVAGNTTLRAVGTAFSVLVRENQTVDVLVTEGRVAIRPLAPFPLVTANAAPPPTLGPGEIATVGNAGATILRLEPDGVARRLAWTRGRLVFNGQTLAEAATEFNLYNHCKLVIGDPQVAELQVGGTFLATDPISFVSALGRTLNVRVRNDGDSISGSNCAAGGQLVLVGAD